MSVGRGGPGRRRRWRDVRVYAGSASEICPPRHPMVWVLTDYVDGQWTRLDQYLMPADLTCKGYCPLEPKKGRKPRNSGIPGNCYSADNLGN